MLPAFLTVYMGDRVRYSAKHELDSKETEKLLEETPSNEQRDDPTRTSTGDSETTHTVSWEEGTSLPSPPKSGSTFTSLLARPRSDNRTISFLRCFYSGEEKVEHLTPFAVVLLIVLLAIYVLNQADRLVLPVVIPNGLRCNVGQEDCSNSSRNASNASGSSGDCIQFNDDQQGLLTGWFIIHNLYSCLYIRVYFNTI